MQDSANSQGKGTGISAHRNPDLDGFLDVPEPLDDAKELVRLYRAAMRENIELKKSNASLQTSVCFLSTKLFPISLILP